MRCEICGKEDKCHPRCPNYISEKFGCYCSICGEGIYNGEEYIENDKGEMRHFDCFQGIKELLEWLGYSIKSMNE